MRPVDHLAVRTPLIADYQRSKANEINRDSLSEVLLSARVGAPLSSHTKPPSRSELFESSPLKVESASSSATTSTGRLGSPTVMLWWGSRRMSVTLVWLVSNCA